MKLSGLFTHQARWCKNCIARDKEERILDNINTFYCQRIDRKGNIYYQEFRNDDKAYSYSLYGAIIKLYEEDARNQILEKLRDAIFLHTGKIYWIAQYNNLPETTFHDIQRILEIANL